MYGPPKKKFANDKGNILQTVSKSLQTRQLVRGITGGGSTPDYRIRIGRYHLCHPYFVSQCFAIDYLSYARVGKMWDIRIKCRISVSPLSCILPLSPGEGNMQMGYRCKWNLVVRHE
jgi:hypothetical protein